MKFTYGEIISQTELRGYESNQFATDGEEWIIRKMTKQGACLIDVGANVGNWCSLALSIQPNIRLVAFEPVPRLFSFLHRRISPFSTEVHQMAISNHCGTDYINTLTTEEWDVEAWDWGGSSLYPRQCLVGKSQAIPVQTETLDHYCQTQNISHIDFLKIDVEGNEQRVLQGADQLLTAQRITALQFEYGGTFPEAGVLLKDVIRYLTNKKYAIFRLYYGGMIHIASWDTAMENARGSNYVALLPSEVPGVPLTAFP